MTLVTKQIFHTHLGFQTVHDIVLRSVDQILLSHTHTGKTQCQPQAHRGWGGRDTETLGEQQDGLCGHRCHSVHLLEGATWQASSNCSWKEIRLWISSLVYKGKNTESGFGYIIDHMLACTKHVQSLSSCSLTPKRDFFVNWPFGNIAYI